VTAALDEYIQRRKQQDVLPLFGTIEYDAAYDSKRERRKKRVNVLVDTSVWSLALR
jgi:hypothetical protein